MLSGPGPKRLLPILVAAALVVGAAIWPTGEGSEAEAAPGARTTYTMVVPAAAFATAFEGPDYVNSGWYLSGLDMMGGFVASVSFPYPMVTVTGITLHAYDNGSGDICLGMLRARPGVGAVATMASFCSSGQSSTDPRNFPAPGVEYRTLNGRYHGAYLQVLLPSGVNYKFYGVTIRYQA